MNSVKTAEFVSKGRVSGTPTVRPLQVSHDRKQNVLVLGTMVLILLLIAPLAYKTSGLSPESLIYPASLTFTILFALQIWSWQRLTNSLFDPYIIFLSAAAIFNGSRAILQVFQLNYEGVLGPGFSSATTLSTIYLVTLGLWSFHLGGSIGASTGRPIQARSGEPRLNNPENLRMFGWLLIAIAIVPSVILLRAAVTLVLSVGYMAGLFQQESVISLHAAPQLLALFLVPGTLLVAVSSKERRLQLAVATGLTGLYAATQLFLGSRGAAVTAIVPYVWLWHRCIKPIPKIVLTAAVLLGLLTASLIGVSRAFIGADRYSADVLLQSLYSIDNPAVSAISEMGGTATTVAHTVELVPESRPYDYGSSYGFAALTLMPNLFWDIHPTIAHGTPNKWLIWTVNPWIAERGGGLGYSFLAEAYLNAGWIGVILIPAMLGFAFAKVTLWASEPGDLAKLACAATILAFSIKYARADASEIVRGVVWYALLPYLVVRTPTAMVSRSRSASRATLHRWTREGTATMRHLVFKDTNS